MLNRFADIVTPLNELKKKGLGFHGESIERKRLLRSKVICVRPQHSDFLISV